MLGLRKKIEDSANVYKEAFINAFEQFQAINCAFCTGIGHRVGCCPSKRKLDRKFRQLGAGFAWGGYKSVTYGATRVDWAHQRQLRKKKITDDLLKELQTPPVVNLVPTPGQAPHQ